MVWISSNAPQKDFKEDVQCYSNICTKCESCFHGHKYRNVCKECLEKPMKYYIYNSRNRRYWKAKCKGTTKDVSKAFKFTKEEATAIVAGIECLKLLEVA